LTPDITPEITPPGTDAPRIEDAIVRGPEALRPPLTPLSWTPEVAPALAAPSKPWYRRRITWIIATAALALGGLATGLVLTVFAPSGPASAASVLKADGYPVTMLLSPDQFGQIAGASGGDVAAVKPFITGVAVGFRNGHAEEVFGLTSAGTAYVSAHAGQVPNLGGSLAGSGATARMESGDLVITGPVSAFTGTGAQPG
jgi:hypothetical protein